MVDSNLVSGKKKWVIADGFLSVKSNGDYVSHEGVCVLNLGQVSANIKLTIYFEDRQPLKGIKAKCDPERTNHIRLDKISNEKGEKIPRGVPYAIQVISDQAIVVQHTRLDTTQPELALMTTMAY